MRLGFNRQSDKRFVIAFGRAGDFIDRDATFLGDRRRRTTLTPSSKAAAARRWPMRLALWSSVWPRGLHR